MKNKHTAGQWKFNGNNDKGKNKYNEFLVVSDKYCIAKIPHMGSSNICCSDEAEAEANAQLIAHAPELLQMVYDLKQCIKRLTQDDLTQFDRDLEANWEGEAHELLTRINPDWYDNANKFTTKSK